MTIDRRDALRVLAGGAAVFYGADLFAAERSSTHTISLSFDDGFAKSFRKVAEIHQRYELSACFNVIASGHLPSFQGAGEYILPELMGDFELWNQLQEAGHEVMPHSWKHDRLTDLPHAQACDQIDKCLEYFEEHLSGFKANQSIFNFPYNASSKQLHEYCLKHVAAVRTSGPSPVNQLEKTKRVLSCHSKGPQNCDRYVASTVQQFLDGDGGWLIINTHGLDGEGWGPITSLFLDQLLSRLVGMKHVAVAPVGATLKQLRDEPVTQSSTRR